MEWERTHTNDRDQISLSYDYGREMFLETKSLSRFL